MKRKQKLLAAAICAVITLSFIGLSFVYPIVRSSFSDEPKQDERITELVYYFFGDVYRSDAVKKATVNPFDYSLFDFPEGKDVAFYKQRSLDISDSYQAYKDAVRHNGRIADVDLEERLSAESYRCQAYLTQAPDFKRDENAWPGNLYHIGLAYYGKVDELTEELDAELTKEEPDQVRVNLIRHDLTIAETAKAIQENRFDSFLDAKIEKSLADKTPNEAGSVIGALGRLGRFDLRDAAEWSVGKAFAQADVPALSSYVESVGEARRRRCFGKELELEGVFTDGTEFSWDDYRGKAVLVCCVPKTSRPEEEPVNALSAYRAYHDYGLEIVWYAPDDEETFSNGDLLKDLPGKVISQKATRAAKDKDYLDFSLFYCEKNQPSAYIVGKSGKVVGSRVFDAGFLTGPAREYPEAAEAEIERLLKALADKDRDFKSKMPDLGLAAELFKTFDPTKEEIDAFAARLQKALGVTNPAPTKPQKQAADKTKKPGKNALNAYEGKLAANLDELKKDGTSALQFDYSLFDVPEGKNVAFYQQRLRDLNDTFSEYSVAAIKKGALGALKKDDDVTEQMRPAQARCRAYMSQAPDFNRHESEETERIYYDGLAYLGKVDELIGEINAALNQKEPDLEKAFNLQRRLATAQAVNAVKENRLDSLIDSIVENSTQKKSSEALIQIEGVFLALGDLGKKDLLDPAEYRLSKAALQSNNQILRQRVGSYALKHTSQSVGKALKLEGVCTDGTEFSWDDYRGKTVLVCVIPPADYIGADQWNSFNRLTDDLLSACQAYREYGFEVVGYAVDTIEGMGVKPGAAPPKKAKSKGVEPKDLPWKIVSQKASREAKDKDYLDFTTFYGSPFFPMTFLVDEDGKVVSTETNSGELRLSLAQRYPEGAKTEIENILNVPEGRDRDFYDKLIINDLPLATEIFKTFNPTMEENAEFGKRVEKARVEAIRQRDRLPQN